MSKQFFRLVIFVFILTIHTDGFAQLIDVGLVEDPVRAIKESETTSMVPKNAKILSTVYSDTLDLPFFEDFTGVVARIDSLVTSTSDNLLRVYDKKLNALPDGTPVYIGFVNVIPNTLQDTLRLKTWYIEKISDGVFSIDTSGALATPMALNANNKYTNAYWRKAENKYTGFLDTLKWVKGGDTYINNRFPLNPISYNVASFDGLKANGAPYNNVDVLLRGYSDQLTSLPINLSGLNASNNVYFSFYWQHAGLGEAPETEDFLELQFRDVNGIWNTVLEISGDTSGMEGFKYEKIQLTDPLYFYKHFQFRFRSYGRLSGPFDIWHVDYIYLDKDRVEADSRVFDFTIGNAEETILKNYTAMPYGQYFADKNNEIGNLEFTLNNLDRNLTTIQSIQGRSFVTTSAGSYNYFYQSDAASHFTDLTTLTYQDECEFPDDRLENKNLPMELKIRYTILGSNDTVNIMKAYNNTFVAYCVLWDFYAYDDGSPEWSVGANQIGARVANKFKTTIKDTLTHIDIYFTRSKGPNMEGRTILLSVWNESNTLVYEQPVQVKYGGFVRYKLNSSSPIIIGAGKEFYVGYRQNFVDLLSVGYDKNYNHSDKVYFSLDGSNWLNYSEQPGFVKGSLMVRPVFSKNQELVMDVVEEMEEEFSVWIYPQPAREELAIKGNVAEVTLYDLAGRAVAEASFNPYSEDKILNTNFLSPGMYILEAKNKTRRTVLRVLIQ